MFFHELSITIFFRAVDTGLLSGDDGVDRIGVFTLRISATGKKFTETAGLDNHGLSAFFAHPVGDFIFLRLHRLDIALLIPGIVTGIGALGITVAGQEMSIPTHLDAEFILTLRTGEIR